MSPTPRTRPPVPVGAEAVTASWLESCVDFDLGSGPLTVTRIGTDYGLAGTILRVGRGDRSVVVKLWRARSRSGLREVDVRERLGDRLGVRVPRCWYAAADEDTGRAVLVLEDLHDAVQGDCLIDLDLDRAAALGHGFARLHSTWWRGTDVAAANWLPTSPVLSLDDDWLNDRAGEYLERFGDKLSKHFRAFVSQAPDHYHRARQHLTNAAPTLLHGDVHLDNVLFDAKDAQPILLDWSHTSTGPGVLDIAELILAGPQAGEKVVDAYRSGLARHGVPETELRDFDTELAAAVVIALIRNSLGIARWRPDSARAAAMIDTALRRCETVAARSTARGGL